MANADDPKTVIIENIKDLEDLHTCKSVDKLTDIQVNIARMEESAINQAASFQELSARFDELSKQIQQVLFSRHECHQIQEMKRQAVEIDFLKTYVTKQEGASRWQERVDKLIDGAIIAVAVALVLWFMKGGAIT